MIAYAGVTSYQYGKVFERKSDFSYWAIGYIHHGTIQIEKEGQAYVWPSRIFSITEPNISYNMKYGTQQEPLCKESWVIFTPRDSWGALMNWPEIAPGLMRLSVLDPETEAEMLDLLQAVNTYINGVLPDKNFFAENILERFLLLAHLNNPMTHHARISKPILATMNFIVQNYAKEITVKQLSEKANLSPSRFAHLFRQQVGTTPVKYLEQYRMEKARQLLLSSQKAISEIAEEVGFNCPFYFSTRFRKHTRKNPKAFRELYRGG